MLECEDPDPNGLETGVIDRQRTFSREEDVQVFTALVSLDVVNGESLGLGRHGDGRKRVWWMVKEEGCVVCVC
jgi:hypothetical protein